MAQYPIKLISQKTGLSTQLIRAWESRYQAIVPHRSDNNRRLYDDDDLERLLLLSKLVEEGQTISQVASLPTDDLKAMLKRLLSQGAKANSKISADSVEPGGIKFVTSGISFASLVQRAFGFIRDAQPNDLDELLEEVGAQFEPQELIEGLIVPLMERVGEEWERGDLAIAQEHAASVVVRTFLTNMRRAYRIKPQAPKVVLASTEGQYHELGALVAAATASSVGWEVIYLGPNTPLIEIITLALEQNAQLIAISVPYFDPQQPNPVSQYVRVLSEMVPRNMSVVFGGDAAHDQVQVIRNQGYEFIESMPHFKEFLWSITND